MECLELKAYKMAREQAKKKVYIPPKLQQFENKCVKMTQIMKQNRLDYIRAICELIEDKDYPAKRNITDYVELLIRSYDSFFANEVRDYINEFYKKIDIKE